LRENTLRKERKRKRGKMEELSAHNKGNRGGKSTKTK